jgi:cell volume regulation protein A
VVVFVGLGLTVHKVNLAPVWKDGLLIALVLAFVARPLGIAPFLVPLRLRQNERIFVIWSGLKGAVPILLAAFALIEQVPGADRIYGIVFVVVAFSVICQGSTVPVVARRLGIPMRLVYRGDP